MKELIEEWKYRMSESRNRDTIIAIFGPTGCGKTTYKNHLTGKGWRHIKSFTTRPPRTFEEKEYHFVSPKEFNDLFNRGLMINTNRYDGHYYGTNINDFHQPGKAVIITDISSVSKINRFAEQNGRDIRFMHCAIDDPEEYERRHHARGTPDRVALMKREMENENFNRVLSLPGIRQKVYVLYDLQDLDEFVEEIENESEA